MVAIAPYLGLTQNTDFKTDSADTKQGKTESGKNYEMNFSVTQIPASFPDGDDSLFVKIFREIKFPPEAISAKLKGTVNLAFDVTYEGNVRNVIIFSGVGYGIDGQIEKILCSLKFIPATTNGTTYTTQQFLNIPVDYSLFYR